MIDPTMGGEGHLGGGGGVQDSLPPFDVTINRPRLWAMMLPYRQQFCGKVFFGKILKGANIQIGQLPTLSNYLDRDRSTICCMRVLGECKFSEYSRKNSGHVPPPT